MSSGVGSGYQFFGGGDLMLIVVQSMFVLGTIQEIMKRIGVDFSTLGTQLLVLGLVVIPLGFMTFPIFSINNNINNFRCWIWSCWCWIENDTNRTTNIDIESMITNLLPMVGGILSLSIGITD